MACNQVQRIPNKGTGCLPLPRLIQEFEVKLTLIVLLILGAVVIAAAFVVGPSLQGGLSFGATPKGTRVRVEPIRMGKLVETIKAPGQIEPRTKVDISAEVAARIIELPIPEGQQVRRGDVVVRLDDREFKATLASAQANSEAEQFRLQIEQSRLAGLNTTLTFARRQLERKQALFDTGDLPRKDLDDALERVEDVQTQINSAKHSISVIESSLAGSKAEIDRVNESLSKTVIIAPMDGVITALNAEVGEVVLMGTMNNPGTVILTIADLSRMILNAEVAESDVARVSVGQAAKVHINAYRDIVFSGTVTQIALQRTNRQTDNTGYFKTEVEIDLQGRLILSGLIANVDIEIAAHEGLLVESQAIVDRLIEEQPDQIMRDNPLVDRTKKHTTVLYRLVNGKSVCTPVKRGPSDDTHSIVLAGANENDVAVLGPFKVLEKLKHDEPLVDEATVPAEDSGKKGDTQESQSGVSVTVG